MNSKKQTNNWQSMESLEARLMLSGTAPTIVFSADPYTITEGDSAVLDASGTTDPDMDAMTFNWDLNNDGTYEQADAGNNPTFDWATLQAAGITDNGSYTIGLQVDDGSNVVTDTVTLTVNNATPSATLTGNANVNEESSYTLNVAVSDPGDDTVSMIVVNWGDGTNPEVVSAGDSMHTYESEGSYTINVSVMDEDGYHTNIQSKSVTVDNAAPSIVNGATVSLAAINEDIAAGSNAGQDVNSLFLPHYSDDADDFAGVAIIANAADAATEGAWQYSTDSGTSWTTIATGIDQSSAIVLGPGHLLRFQPVANFTGTPGALDVRLWDGGGAATAGQANDITGELGGTGAYAGSAIAAGITVNPQADAPTFSSPAETSATEDVLYTYNITATDADTGDTLTITALAKPTWLTFTDNGDGTATLSGTPTNNEVGDHSISLQVADGDGNLGTQAFTLTVANANDAPTLENAIADQTATEDAAFSFQVPADTFDDIDVGDTLTYTATQADDSALPAWLTFNAGTRTFSGTPTNSDVGTLSVKVTADDGNGGTISDTFDITISNVNDAPTVPNPIADQTATEDVAFNYQVPADAFNDVDAGDTLTYTATLADDSALPGWLTFTAGTRTFSGTPLNANVGTIAVKVTATDGSSATVSDTFNITVNNANDAPTLDNPIADETATEDSAYSFTFDANVFGDVDAGDTLTYTATKADDSALPAWLSFNAGTRTFSGTPLNDDVGTLSIKVTASDGTATVSDTFDIVISAVNDAAVISVPSAQTINEDASLTFSSGNSNAISISDDSGSNDVSITLTVTQGTLDVTLDGTATITAGADQSATMTISGTVTEINNTLEGMIYSPTANYAGSDTLSISVNDGGNTGSGGAQTSNSSVTVNVTSINDAPVLNLDSNDSGGNSPNFATAYTENAVAVAILDADATVADVDTTNLASIIISITNFATGDVLAADTSGTSVSKSYNTSTGVMTLSGADTVANYQQVLRTLTYVNSGDNPGSTKTITFVANDGSTDSASVSTTITITTDDDAPSGITNTGITLNEGATATISTSELTVADADTANSAITFTVVTKPTNGTLYKNGVALNNADTFTLADIASSLITYTHNGGETITDSLVFTYEDATNGASGNQTFTFTVTAVNDAPVLSLDDDNSGGSAPNDTAAYTENAGATGINTDATITDAEADNLVSMTITITNFQTGDTLDCTNGALTKNYNTSTGVLTLTGSQAASVYQGALRSLTFTTASNDPGSSRTITVVTNDGTTNSNTATLTLNITVDDDAPAQNANTGANVNEDESHTVTTSELDFNDPDNTDTEIVYTITTAPTHGTLYLNGVALALNGTFTQTDIGNSLLTYTNADGVSDSFGFSVTDGNTVVAGQTFSFTVSAVNDAPVVNANTGLTVAEGAADQVISATELDFNDAEQADSAITYTITTAPTNGALKLSGVTLGATDTFTQQDIVDGNLKYTHDGGETTSDSFIFNVSDGAGGSVTAQTFAITVTAVNDTPVLTKNVALGVNEGGSGTITAGKLLVLDNDVASDAQIIFTVETASANGTLYLDGVALGVSDTFTQDDIYNGLVTYTHDSSETSTDSFVFSVSDSAGGTIGNTTFDITVTAQNDDPTVSVNSVAVATTAAITDISEDDTITFSAGNSNLIAIADTDAAAGDLTVTLTVTRGTLNITDASGVTIDAGADESATMTITGTVAEINTALNGMVYTPASPGGETMTIVMNDGGNTGAGGGTDVTRTITFNINANPTIDANTGITLDEGATEYITPTDLAVTDTDNTASQLTFTIQTAPANGTLYLDGVALGASDTFTQDDIVNGGGNSLLTYTHNGGETTTDSFVFSVADGSGGAIGNTTFNITVNAVNDSPVLATNTGATFNEASASNTISNAMLAVTDAEQAAAARTFTLTAVPTNGTLYLDGVELAATDTFTQADVDGSLLAYTHDGSETTSDSFAFTVADGVGGTIAESTFTITITPVNDAPVEVNNTGQTVTEDISSTVLNTKLSYSDVDNTTAELTYTIVTKPAHGTMYRDGVALDNGGTFTQADINSSLLTYTNVDGIADSFVFTVGDGTVTSGNTTFSFTVAAANDLPVQQANTGTTVDEAASGTITQAKLEYTDAEQAASELFYTIKTAPVNGTLYLDGVALALNDTFTQADINNSLVTYTHDGSETISDSFGFDLSDGVGGNITAQTFAITVTPVSDMPTETNNTGLAVTEDSSSTITSTELLYEDIDNTAAQLTYTVTAKPADGTLYLNGVALNNTDTFTQDDINNNLLTYTNADGADSSFTFTVGDGTNTTGAGTFNFTTTSVNDAPAVSTNTGDTLNEAATATIGQAKLEATDDDNVASELTYTVTTIPTNGKLYLDGVELAANDTFTQADINSNLLTYTHDGGETTTDSFVVDVVDGAGGSVSSTTFSLTITPVNDAPTMAANEGVTVDEASTGTVITTAMLQIADAEESTAANLTYTLDVAPTRGTLKLSGVALGATDTFTQADIDAGNVTYDHDGSEQSSDSFDFTADDGAGGSVAGTFSITVTPVNEDPTISFNGGAIGAPENIAAINEEGTITFSAGNSYLIAIADVDVAGADLSVSIAVTKGTITLNAAGTAALSNLSGDGTAAVSFDGTIAEINAAIDSMVYTAIAPNTGSETITITVNDNGYTGAVSGNDVTGQITFTINDAKSAPILDSSTAMSLTTVAEDTASASITGDTVAAILATGAGGDPITLPDGTGSGEIKGIAVTAVDDTNGTWQYSTDSGTSWTAFGAVADNSAVVLSPDANNMIRFIPNANYFGTPQITFRAWDSTDGSSSGDTAVDASTNGGTSAFSEVAAAVSITISDVNDAPVLDGSVEMTLNAIAEDIATVDNVGTLVSDILATGAGGDPISDIDDSPVEGIAVIDIEDTDGTWQYTLDGGTTWVDFGSPGYLAATLLTAGANDRIRFIPGANWSGSASISFVAWDTSDGRSAGDTGVNIATSGTGGTNAFSLVANSASITIAASNDAPTLDDTGDPVVTGIDEDVVDGSNTGMTVSALLATCAGGDPITDIDTGAVDGIAVTAVDDANGTWQFSTDGGTTWTAFGAVASSSAVTLTATANDKIRFVPDSHWFGDATITFRAWDTSDGSASGDSAVDTSINGGTAAFSNATETATITVTSVEDAPTLDNPIADQSPDEDAAFSFTVPANTFSDADPGDTLTYTAALADDSALPDWLSFDAATLTFSGTPDNGDVGAIDVKVVASDGDQTISDTFQITVNNTNDAPVLDTTAMTVTAITEDIASGANTGMLVSDLLATGAGSDPISDVDAGAVDGIAVTAVDDTNGTWQYSTDGGTTWTDFGAVTENASVVLTATANDRIRFQPDANFDSDATITFRAWDTADGSATGDSAVDASTTGGTAAFSDGSATATISVTPVNDTPTLDNPIVDQAATDDVAFSFTVPANTFSDVDTLDTLTYSATLADDSALPDWLSFDAATQTFSGTPADGDVGTISIKVTATDGSATLSDTFDIVVSDANDAPVLDTTAMTVTAVTEDIVIGSNSGMLVSDLLATGAGSDPISDADAVTVDGIAVTGVDDTNGTWQYSTDGGTTWTDFGAVSDSAAVVLTVTANDKIRFQPDADFDSDATITFRAWDTTDGSATGDTVDASTNGGTTAFSSDAATAAISVTPVNDTPTLDNPIADQTATDDVAFSFTVPANTFSDVDTPDTLTYTATLADDSALPAWLSFDAATQTFSGTPADGDVGTISIKVSATDGSATLSDTFDLVVSDANDAPSLDNAIADQSATEDSAFSFVVPGNTFSDVDAGDSLTYTATLADDSALPAWLSFDAGTLTFSGTPANGDVGSIDVKVTATDTSSAATSDTFTITIANVNDAPTLDNAIADQSATEDSAFSFVVPGNTFSDVDAGDSLSYTATLADDSALPAWLSFDAATQTFSGTPANGDVGSIDVKVTATDGSSIAVSDTFTITVANTNDAPVIEDQALSMAEDIAVNGSVGTLVATDVDAGDTLTWSITGGANAAMFDIDSATGEVTIADITGVDFETTTSYSFEVTVEDGSGQTDTAIITINVTNVNESPSLTGGEATIAANIPNGDVVATVTATDPDAGETFTYDIIAGNTAGAYAVNASGQVVVADNTALVGNTVDTLTVRVTDAGGLTSSATVTVTVTNVDLLPEITDVEANASLIAGDNVVVSVSMTNNGMAKATDVAVVTIFAVPDGGGDDIELYSSNVNTGIGVGGTRNYAFTVTIPNEATMPVGGYTLMMTVQYGEVVSQVTDATVLNVDEANIAIGTTIDSHTLNAGLLPGADGTVRVMLTNNGNTISTEDAVINIYVSTDTAFDDGIDTSIVVASFTVATNLQPGESKFVNIPVVIPEIAALSDGAGDYYIVATCDYVDADSASAQSEDAFAETIRIDEPFEDLTAEVTASTFADNVVAGDKGKVIVTVSNVGNIQTTGNIEIRLYASTDGNVAGATEIGTMITTAINLAANGSKSFAFKFTMPTLDTDDYHLVAEVTVVDGVNEDPADEDNNAVATVDAFAFDLMFGSFADRTRVPLTVTDPATGNDVRFTLAGDGYGTLVYDAVAGAYDITFTDTTDRTKVVISTLDRGATIDINDISVPADGATPVDLGKLIASDINITGDIDISGTVSQVVLGDMASVDEQAFTIGDSDSAVKITLGEVSDVSLISGTPISALTVESWSDDETVTADTIEADWIGTIKSDGVFDAGLTLDVDTRGRSLAKAIIGGQVTGAVWDAAGIISVVSIAGDVDTLDIAAVSLTSAVLKGDLISSSIDLTQPLGARTKAIGKLLITGTLAGTAVTTLDNIGTISLGAMVGSNIFAGVQNGVTGLPDVGEFVAADGDGLQAGIATFIIKPLAPSKSGGFGAAGRFVDSAVAAGSIRKAIVSDVDFDNGGTPFGFAADSLIKLAIVYTGKTAIGKLKNNTWVSPLDVDAVDFEVRIV